MADKVIRVRECDIPNCPTPTDDVKRVTSDIEGGDTVVYDVCATHIAPLLELRKYAHKKLRRRGIQVVDPDDVRKTGK
jgi:hypothetical protein